jgi:hypothetical protein
MPKAFRDSRKRRIDTSDVCLQRIASHRGKAVIVTYAYGH